MDLCHGRCKQRQPSGLQDGRLGSLPPGSLARGKQACCCFSCLHLRSLRTFSPLTVGDLVLQIEKWLYFVPLCASEASRLLEQGSMPSSGEEVTLLLTLYGLIGAEVKNLFCVCNG